MKDKNAQRPSFRENVSQYMGETASEQFRADAEAGGFYEFAGIGEQYFPKAKIRSRNYILDKATPGGSSYNSTVLVGEYLELPLAG